MSILHSNTFRVVAQYVLLFVLVYFVIFLKLDSFHMRWWDESMFAVNTYEMMENGHYFSLYYDGRPDLFNTKPPLTNWLQICFVKLFGYNELALRLPSALASCISVFVVFRFMSKKYSYLWAWMSCLVLLTSVGYISFHTSRTADADALLSLFLLVTNIYFLKFIFEEYKFQVLWFFIFITLAFTTKLYAALLFTPAYLGILLYKKRFKSFVFNWQFLVGSVFFIFTALLLIYLRETETPGYLDEILNKDAGRMFNVVENHVESNTYYVDLLFNSQFIYWTIPLIIGLIYALVYNGDKAIKLVKTLSILLITYLVIITFSITKLSWYTMPLFPYLSIVSAYGLYMFVTIFRSHVKSKKIIFTIGILVLIFGYPYANMYSKTQASHINLEDRKIEADAIYLHHTIQNNKVDLNNTKILFHGWNGSLIFYKYKLKDLGTTISLHQDCKNFKIGDQVLVSNDSLKTELKKQFELKQIDEFRTAKLFELK